jgi:hypothetical protein
VGRAVPTAEHTFAARSENYFRVSFAGKKLVHIRIGKAFVGRLPTDTVIIAHK